MITFSKLRDGSWGLRGPVAEVAAGATVTVSRRDGGSSPARVGRVIWSGDGVALATIAAGNGNGASYGGARRGGCGCDCGECSPRCQCEAHCNCRGGNIYDC